MRVKKLDADRILIQMFPDHSETVISPAQAGELFNGLKDVLQGSRQCTTKTIIIKIEIPDGDLEGYEDCDDQLIVEDFLRGSHFERIGFEILPVKRDETKIIQIGKG